jgi:NAD(P)-dependent dehydrogenase (short-subunit alcohol dehydrogenase family)
VTGTSSGIGLHTAVQLAAKGLRVVATMRDPSRSGPLLETARAAGVEVEVHELDVLDGARAETLVGGLGAVDVLVNNAGRGSVATLERTTDADLQAQLDLNYLAVARLTRLVLPGMRAAGRGRVVTVTSVGGAVGQRRGRTHLLINPVGEREEHVAARSQITATCPWMKHQQLQMKRPTSKKAGASLEPCPNRSIPEALSIVYFHHVLCCRIYLGGFDTSCL